MSREASWKMPKWKVTRSNNKHFALYVLQFKRFRWIMKLDEKWTPKGYPKSSKIGAVGAQGPNLCDVGRFCAAPVLGFAWSDKKVKKTKRKHLNFDVQIKLPAILLTAWRNAWCYQRAKERLKTSPWSARKCVWRSGTWEKGSEPKSHTLRPSCARGGGSHTHIPP